ncbi:DUF805 domain-containing protein [Methylobacterium brachythecii]|uniref:DUF805 domain-containing protein n=1 Tax=Methylobacterium brachythecii TaxID=1176177 RepID=A0A7W6AJ06_9HYPH|nr:DUF805 domain-containing protein [Methylobacterium brachythecii]MBB3902499.1 uncharacterized membrane protein YhaH (DUF805 family) [Methylobacterium brachythecii]GLS42346.1 DUF805 domain-containing protein [Methylobacterium brachythecii]
MKELLFSAQGRIGRGQFWKGSILFGLALMVVMTIVNLVIGRFIGNQSGEAGNYSVEGAAAVPFILANLALMIPAVWAGICLGIKRYHDRGKSGLWILIMFVPFIGGIWYFVETGFLRGTIGPNLYGADPVPGAALAPIAAAA